MYALRGIHDTKIYSHPHLSSLVTSHPSHDIFLDLAHTYKYRGGRTELGTIMQHLMHASARHSFPTSLLGGYGQLVSFIRVTKGHHEQIHGRAFGCAPPCGSLGNYGAIC